MLTATICLGATLLGHSACGANIDFDIAWLARSVVGSPMSMKAVLKKANWNGDDGLYPVNRPEKPEAHVQNLVFMASVEPGTYPLCVTFYAGPNMTGRVLGTVQTQAKIGTDGKGIGTLAFGTPVASVEIAPLPSLTVAQAARFTAVARDAKGALLALPAESVRWLLMEGRDQLALTSSGIATGLQSGYAKVRALIDGIVSLPYQVAIDNDPDGPEIALDFDDLPSVSVVQGTPIDEAARLSDRYLDRGIRFSSGAGYLGVVKPPAGEAPSGENDVSGSTPDGRVTYAQDKPIVFTFFDPKKPRIRAATKRVSCTADLNGRVDQVIRMVAYDVNGQSIAEAAARDTGGAVLTVEVDKPVIHRVVITSTNGDTDGVALDDIAFRPVVPVE